MFGGKLFLFACVFHLIYCDWVSEWMSPVQQEINNQSPSRKFSTTDELKLIEDETKLVDIPTGSRERSNPQEDKSAIVMRASEDYSNVNIKMKLESTLRTAESLAETLKTQILTVTTREHLLKEAIANGRSGISTVTVSSTGQVSRTYLIRDGIWSLCNGMVQFPTTVPSPSTSLFLQMFSAPRCLGQEVSSPQDPCVFNSIIKYETIPARRGLVYVEDDFLCLKPTFRNTLEQYLSVPKHVINETCNHGIVRSFSDYSRQCGVRILSEYSYYPHRSSNAALLPLEYCTEKDGSCKMIIAWHVSNSSIENFEFLKNEYNFKKYFMKAAPYTEQVI